LRGRGGIGLLSMRERATALGGSFSIRSGEGTVVEVRLPRVHVVTPHEESDLI
jgi:signal transduction histidine kinase